MSSSTEEATSPSNFQLIIEAFADYAKLTGIDLSKSSFAEKLECSNSPQSILEMLQERENAFKEYRDQNRRLITCITPTVEVLHAFSAVLGEAVSLVSKISHCLCPIVTLVRSPSLLQRLSLWVLMLSLLYVPRNLFSTSSPVTYDFPRLPVELLQVMILFWSFSNAWAVSSSVLRSIRWYRPLP